jgi:hypothetical protein
VTVRLYRWDDASAPVVDNAAGDITNLFDKILADGYGAKVAAGWAKEFTGTNKRVYRAAAGNRFRLRVLHTTQWTAHVRGYEVMTSVDVGTGLFPSVAQVAGDGMFLQCDYFGATTPRGEPRPWVAVANDRLIHLWMTVDSPNPSPTFSYGGTLFSFGDFTSFTTGDVYGSSISALESANNFTHSWNHIPPVSGTVFGLFGPRAHTQVGSSINLCRYSDAVLSQFQNSFGRGGLPYPHPGDNGLYLAPVFVGQNTPAPFMVRGRIPGLWNPCHLKPLEHLDTFSGTGSMAGRTFIALNGGDGQVFLETSDTW